MNKNKLNSAVEKFIKSTTILGLIHNGQDVMGGDGQVTLSDTIMKHGARKVRKIYNNKILVGFAGASADALALMERFESKLEQYKGNLLRAATELAKDWRMDKYLRQLNALLAVMDKENALIISGTGDVIEPDDKIVAIGSGGSYALAAARVLVKHSNLSAREIVEEALKVAADICIYTNHNIVIEEL
ncbi:ATP-dependent protease subunit HslV [Candidatus Kryptobacter tengchongensis]|uniref:ATP-dependent protease subunit HslV n=1 Tax=Kryptobacter tengchongensis TaxID=1643429 RepID=UPI002A4E28D7|nr:ATP-dependent protease subunit HslV [Candidatus Kryptobacter tengchongensis]